MILKLLKLEWSKFRKNSVITLLFAFFMLFFPLSLYFGSILDKISKHFPMKVDILSAPLIWDYLGYAGNWIVFFFLGVMIIYTVTIDVRNKTLRQNIITGMSRTEYYLSKMIMVVLLATIATLYYFLLALVIGWINTDGASLSKILDNDLSLPRFWLMSFAYLNFALFLAFIIRKAGIAVFIYLTYILIAEPLIKIWMQKYLPDSKLMNFLPMNSVEDLMPLPVFKMAENLTTDGTEYLLSHGQAAIATVIYSILFIFLAYRFFLNKDM